MRFLIVGAGAMGGYFGGRLLESGEDVTFLVRERRAQQLKQNGLNIKSQFGDVALPSPPVLLADQINSTFDAVVIGSKAYDLDSIIDAVAPAVGADTLVLPLLNGMRHIDVLSERFGGERVIGGLCQISATVDANGTVLHLNDTHTLAFGERAGGSSPRVVALASAMKNAKFNPVLSEQITQEMWEKWIFIASLASITSLMRGTIGDIMAAGQDHLIRKLFGEASAIAAENGYVPRDAARDRFMAMLTTPGSPISASMAKDIERGSPVEAEHIVGDLIKRGHANAAPLLGVAYAHLMTYQARRAREQA
jgi:2-dehydropantoate 2-reductase